MRSSSFVLASSRRSSLPSRWTATRQISSVAAAERTARKENLASVSVNREVRSDIRGAPFVSG